MKKPENSLSVTLILALLTLALQIWIIATDALTAPRLRAELEETRRELEETRQDRDWAKTAAEELWESLNRLAK